MKESQNKKIRVILAGNPNVGKTTILNHLVKGNLKIGNWPGVTVEKKEGRINFQDYEIVFIDLPGLYTLEEVISEDEKIALNYLLYEDYDVILNIIETSRIERDLYLTCQLLDIGKPMILVLNMIDEAKEFGIEVNEKRLSELLNIEIIKTNGRTGEGVIDILPKVIESYEKNKVPIHIIYSPLIEEKIKNTTLPRWLALEKLIEKEPKLYEMIKEKRLNFSQGLIKEVSSKRLLHKRTFTEILDNFFLNPFLGNIAFFIMMYLFFKISFDFSAPLIEWIDQFMQNFLTPLTLLVLNSMGVSSFLGRFITEGIIGGIGTVLIFLPLIFIMYLILTLLETSGYLPRVAFLMDKFTHKIGLHGQSAIPLILSLGCNVPAIMATKTFQDTKDKLLVMCMIPFISCPARLIVFSFIAFIFFENPGLIIFLLYLIGISFSVLTSVILRKSFLKKELSHFVMDLPPYRIPSFKTVFNLVNIHLKTFIYRAGTIIFLISVIIWLLLNLPPEEKNIENSYIANLGKKLSPIFEPIGLGDWRITTSLLSGFLAREAIVSNMGIIIAQERGDIASKEIEIGSALKDQIVKLGIALKDGIFALIYPLPKTLKIEEKKELKGIRKEIKTLLNKKQALSFLLFVLIYNSCLAVVVVMGREGKWLYSLGFLIYSFFLAWLISFINFNLLW